MAHLFCFFAWVDIPLDVDRPFPTRFCVTASIGCCGNGADKGGGWVYDVYLQLS